MEITTTTTTNFSKCKRTMKEKNVVTINLVLLQVLNQTVILLMKNGLHK